MYLTDMSYAQYWGILVYILGNIAVQYWGILLVYILGNIIGIHIGEYYWCTYWGILVYMNNIFFIRLFCYVHQHLHLWELNENHIVM